MITDISNGVKISVKPEFKADFSKPHIDYYIFAYTIEIVNTNSFPVQLLSRKWIIFDSLTKDRVVEGAGVVGQQPILQPGESYSYTSTCDLSSEIGSMRGAYYFKNMRTDEYLEVTIPVFQLTVPSKLN